MDQIVKFESDHVKIEVALYFPHFWSQFLTNFDVTALKSKLRTSSTRICTDHPSLMPIRGPKMPKNVDISSFWSVFAIFDQFRGVLSLPNLTYLVEEILSFEMSGVTSKSVKNWLQEWRKSESSLCRGMGFLPLVSSDHVVTFVYTGLAAASSIKGREVGQCTHTHPWIWPRSQLYSYVGLNWCHVPLMQIQKAQWSETRDVEIASLMMEIFHDVMKAMFWVEGGISGPSHASTWLLHPSCTFLKSGSYTF